MTTTIAEQVHHPATVDGAAGLPMPATFIVDSNHSLLWIDVHPDDTTRSESELILAALDALAPR